jgi:NADH-quinone oxidoreductase subunit I
MESLTNRKKVVSDKPMTFMEKLYLPAIFNGMFITLKHMFKKNNTIKYDFQIAKQ